MSTRHNPIGSLDDDDDLPPPAVERKPRLPQEQTAQLAALHGFESREQGRPARAAQRRYTTGRNVQINIKATKETADLLYALADQLKAPQGDILERALKALKQSLDT